MKESRCLCLAMAGLLAASCASAAVPGIMNYQGRMLANGALVTSNNVGIVFSVYDAAEGGVLLYSETDSVTVLDGLYASPIGDNPSGGAHATLTEALQHAGSNAWLEVAVAGFGVVAPRQHLLAAPFAMVAPNTAPTWAQYAASADVNMEGAAVVAAGAIDVREAGLARLGGITNASIGTCVVVRNGYAYMACLSDGLRIYDIGRPDTPTQVAHVTGVGTVDGVAVVGHRAYMVGSLLGPAALRVYDVSEPSAPVYLGSAVDVSFADHLVVEGRYAYLSCGAFGLWIYDISDPAAPLLLGQIDDLGGEVNNGLAVSGRYAYLAHGIAGLRIYDVSNPNAPSFAGQIDDSGASAWDVAVDGPVAYVAYGTAGLRIYDVSDASSPSLIGQIDDSSATAYGLSLCGRHVYVAYARGGIRAYDVTDPAHPAFAGAGYTDDLSARDVDVSGELAVLASGDGALEVFRSAAVSSPAANLGSLKTTALAFQRGQGISLGLDGGLLVGGSVMAHGGFSGDGSGLTGLSALGVSGTGGVSVAQGNLFHVAGITNSSFAIAGLAVSADLAYMACFTDGLRVYDVTVPASPVSLAHVSGIGSVRDIAVAGHYAYVVGSLSGSAALRIYDVSRPSAPVYVGNAADTSFADCVAVSGGYAYISCGSFGLWVYDVSDPETPVYLGKIDDLGGEVNNGLVVHGRYAYTAFGVKGLRIYDIADPENPFLAGAIDDSSAHAWDVFVDGTLAYLAYGTDGLRIYDVSNPATPSYVGRVDDVGGTAYAVVTCGRYAYVGYSSSGLRAYDVSDPASPVFAGTTSLPGLTVREVSVVGDMAYVGAQAGSLDLFRVGNVCAPGVACGSLSSRRLEFGMAQGSDLMLGGGLNVSGSAIAHGGFFGDGSRLSGIPTMNMVTSLTEIIVNPLKIIPDDSAPAIFTLTLYSDKVRIVPTGTGDPLFLIPVDIPGVLHGQRMKLYSMTVVYSVANASSYISAVGVNKSTDTGGYQSLVWDTTDLTSTIWTAYTATPSTAKPITGLATVVMPLHFAGTGTGHQISISRLSLMIGP